MELQTTEASSRQSAAGMGIEMETGSGGARRHSDRWEGDGSGDQDGEDDGGSRGGFSRWFQSKQMEACVWAEGGRSTSFRVVSFFDGDERPRAVVHRLQRRYRAPHARKLQLQPGGKGDALSKQARVNQRDEHELRAREVELHIANALSK
uniref:ABC transporter Atr4 n=1 Tax=Ganoderma boninense TaxID=34458 RepID=A0A5K1K7T7_9APHY|nr:ABC transporter Atr4 [Ganoderma boninense]